MSCRKCSPRHLMAAVLAREVQLAVNRLGCNTSAAYGRRTPMAPAHGAANGKCSSRCRENRNFMVPTAMNNASACTLLRTGWQLHFNCILLNRSYKNSKRTNDDAAGLLTCRPATTETARV